MNNKTNRESSLVPLKLKKSRDLINEINKKLSTLSSKQKIELIKNGLKLKPSEQRKTKSIEISKIINLNTYHRCNRKKDYRDLKGIRNLEPIKVATIKGVKEYYCLIDGNRRLQYIKGEGESDIQAEIIGEAVCKSQLGIARAVFMNLNKEPLTNIEKTIGLVRLRRTLLDEFGKKAFYCHGGTRRGQDTEKMSISQFISQQTNLKPWVVQTLLNFGRNLGTYALKGLLYNEGLDDLTLYKIQNINSRIREARLRSTIKAKLSELEKSGTSEKEKIEIIGTLVLDFIIKALEQSKGADSKSISNQNSGSKSAPTIDLNGPTPGQSLEGDLDNQQQDSAQGQNGKSTDKKEETKGQKKDIPDPTKALKHTDDIIIEATRLKKAISNIRNKSEFPSDNILKIMDNLKNKCVALFTSI